MDLKELVEKLQALLEEHGDLQVFYEYTYSVGTVKVVEVGKNNKFVVLY